MTCSPSATAVELATRQSLPLRDARGTLLRVNRGALWITQENDTQDIVLRAGDTWVIERDGLTIVEAQSATSLCVATGPNVGTVFAARTGVRRGVAVGWARVRHALAALFAGAESRRTAAYY